MAAEIYMCFECGQKNRIPVKADRTLAKCGQCNSLLFPDESRTTTKPASTGQDSPSQRPQSPPESSSGLHLLAVIAIIVGAVWYFQSNKASSSKSYNTQQVNLPPIINQNAGVMWNSTGRQLVAPLTIKTSFGSDYYVKLVGTLSNQDEVGIFVKGGSPIKVLVPLGSFKMRYASGKNWRGYSSLFGPGSMTSYAEAGSTFSFINQGTHISGYTVELIKQSQGNLSTRRISAGNF